MMIVEDLAILKKKSVEFDFSTDFQILEDLKKTIEGKANAAGLAAPQIGSNKRAFIGKLNDGYRFFINPEIKKIGKSLHQQKGGMSFFSWEMDFNHPTSKCFDVLF